MVKGTTKIVYHYHINNWLDGTAPKESPGLKFLVEKLVEDLSSNAMPLVHCSAGVGRTGTLIAMAGLRMMINSN